MSFGRKGLQPGQSAPQPAGGFGRAGHSSPVNATSAPAEDDIAAKRAAFIASERARKQEEIGGGSLPDANGEYSDDPMVHLRNGARPATPLPEQERSNAGQYTPSPNQQLEMQRAARARSGSNSGFVFGDPGGRSVGLAYVLWFILGQLSIHRFYCGQSESAWLQLSLFIGSLITLFAMPILGIIGFIGWCGWIVADLFLIPGMMRRFKAENAFSSAFT